MTAPTRTETRVQRSAPAENLIYDGKLSQIFTDYTGKQMLVVIPRQNCQHITDMYPVDMAFLFNEVQRFLEQMRVRAYTMRIHRRDWNYSFHCHLQVTMPRAAYTSLVRTLGIDARSSPCFAPPAPTAPPAPPAPSPTCPALS